MALWLKISFQKDTDKSLRWHKNGDPSEKTNKFERKQPKRDGQTNDEPGKTSNNYIIMDILIFTQTHSCAVSSPV